MPFVAPSGALGACAIRGTRSGMASSSSWQRSFSPCWRHHHRHLVSTCLLPRVALHALCATIFRQYECRRVQLRLAAEHGSCRQFCRTSRSDKTPLRQRCSRLQRLKLLCATSRDAYPCVSKVWDLQTTQAEIGRPYGLQACRRTCIRCRLPPHNIAQVYQTTGCTRAGRDD